MAIEGFGDRVRSALALRDMKQGDLAKRCGSSDQYISDLIRGRKNASKRMIERMAIELNVDTDWLIDGKGDMARDQGLPNLAHLTSSVLKAGDCDTRRLLALTLGRLTQRQLDVLADVLDIYEDEKKKAEANSTPAND